MQCDSIGGQKYLVVMLHKNDQNQDAVVGCGRAAAQYAMRFNFSRNAVTRMRTEYTLLVTLLNLPNVEGCHKY